MNNEQCAMEYITRTMVHVRIKYNQVQEKWKTHDPWG